MLKTVKGSTLVFALIILGFLLVASLSVAVVSVTDKKSVLSSGKSSIAFQTADAGVEATLQKIYRGTYNSGPLSAMGCSLGTNTIIDATGVGKYEIFFLDASGIQIGCSDSSWRSKVIKIRSEGSYSGTRRAVEVDVKPSGSNIATWNPNDKGTTVILSGGNLTATVGHPYSTSGVRASAGKSSGKWYWEVHVDAIGTSVMIGVANTSAPLDYPGREVNGWGYDSWDGTKYHNSGSSGNSYGLTYTTGDTIGVALDMDAGTIAFYKNGVSPGQAYSGLTGTIFPMVGNGSSGGDPALTADFGATSFQFAVPSGYNSGLYQ